MRVTTMGQMSTLRVAACPLALDDCDPWRGVLSWRQIGGALDSTMGVCGMGRARRGTRFVRGRQFDGLDADAVQSDHDRVLWEGVQGVHDVELRFRHLRQRGDERVLSEQVQREFRHTAIEHRSVYLSGALGSVLRVHGCEHAPERDTERM